MERQKFYTFDLLAMFNFDNMIALWQKHDQHLSQQASDDIAEILENAYLQAGTNRNLNWDKLIENYTKGLTPRSSWFINLDEEKQQWFLAHLEANFEESMDIISCLGESSWFKKLDDDDSWWYRNRIREGIDLHINDFIRYQKPFFNFEKVAQKFRKMLTKTGLPLTKEQKADLFKVLYFRQVLETPDKFLAPRRFEEQSNNKNLNFLRREDIVDLIKVVSNHKILKMVERNGENASLDNFDYIDYDFRKLVATEPKLNFHLSLKFSPIFGKRNSLLETDYSWLASHKKLAPYVKIEYLRQKLFSKAIFTGKTFNIDDMDNIKKSKMALEDNYEKLIDLESYANSDDDIVVYLAKKYQSEPNVKEVATKLLEVADNWERKYHKEYIEEIIAKVNYKPRESTLEDKLVNSANQMTM